MKEFMMRVKTIFNGKIVRVVGFCVIIGIIIGMDISCKKKCYDCSKPECENYDPKCAQKPDPGDTIVDPGDTTVIIDPSCKICKTISDVLAKLSATPTDTALNINVLSGDWIINNADYQNMVRIKELLEANFNFKLTLSHGVRIIPGMDSVNIEPAIMEFFSDRGAQITGSTTGFYYVNSENNPKEFVGSHSGLSGYWTRTNSFPTSGLPAKIVADTFKINTTTDARLFDAYDNWPRTIYTASMPCPECPGAEQRLNYVNDKYLKKVWDGKIVSTTGYQVYGEFLQGGCGDVINLHNIQRAVSETATYVSNITIKDGVIIGPMGLLAWSYDKVARASLGNHAWCPIPLAHPNTTNVDINFYTTVADSPYSLFTNTTYLADDHKRDIISYDAVNQLRQIFGFASGTYLKVPDGYNIVYILQYDVLQDIYDMYRAQYPNYDFPFSLFVFGALKDGEDFEKNKFEIKNREDSTRFANQLTVEQFNKCSPKFLNNADCLSYGAAENPATAKWNGAQKSYRQPAAGTNKGFWNGRVRE